MALAIWAVFILWMPMPARADEGNIQVTLVGAESQYPTGIRFFLSASSSNEIDEIRVFFRKTGKVTAGAYREAEFEEGNLVDAESILATGSGINYIPPGTEIFYFFEIRDEAGESYC